MERIKYLENKKKSNLNFKLQVEIPFSISISNKLSDKFNFITKNDNDDVSKVLRKILLKKLNLKDKREFDLLFEEDINNTRDKIYERLHINRANSFSKIMTEEVTIYMKKRGYKDEN